MKTKIIQITCFLLLILSVSCACKKQMETANAIETTNENTDFKTQGTKLFQEVYYQNWVAGVRGGGGGTNVHFIASKALPETIEILKVSIGNSEITPQKINDTEYVAYFQREINNEEAVGETPKIENALQVTIDATTKVIITYKKDKTIIKEVYQNVKEKPMIAYPSMNKPKN